jgi:hypothetical protein
MSYLSKMFWSLLMVSKSNVTGLVLENLVVDGLGLLVPPLLLPHVPQLHPDDASLLRNFIFTSLILFEQRPSQY